MATFYIQLENKLLQISGELTAENISKALGYVPVSPNVANELSQRVDNITFDSLKDNPFLQDGNGEFNIVDKAGNIVAKVYNGGVMSVDFIAGDHKLSEKADKEYVDEAVKNADVDLTGYATESWVESKNYATKDEIPSVDFNSIENNPFAIDESGELNVVDENGNIGMKLNGEGVFVKDITAGNHILSNKQDLINDLEAIRSGAAKGATALQPGDIPNSAEPMVCAYTIGSYTARTIELINHTYNGQTMDYREGAIISILNPHSADVVFVGGMVTLDGNEYEASAFTLKSGATALFALGPDPGVLLPISSVGGATTSYVDEAIANAITNTLNTPV